MKNPNNSDVPVGQTSSPILRIKHLAYYFQINDRNTRLDAPSLGEPNISIFVFCSAVNFYIFLIEFIQMELVKAKEYSGVTLFLLM